MRSDDKRSFVRNLFSPTDTEVAAATEEGLGCCGNVMAVISFIVIVMFFPFSLLVSIKVSYAINDLARIDRTMLHDYCPYVRALTCTRIDRERVRESCDPSPRSTDVR